MQAGLIDLANTAIAQRGDVGAALEHLGRGLGTDRVYVFAAHEVEGEAAVSQTHEWCHDGVTEELPNLQNCIVAEIGMQRVMDHLYRGEPVAVNIHTMTETERAHLEPQGIKSMLCLPIMKRNDFWGLIGFDQCNEIRSWGTDTINALRPTAFELGLYAEISELQLELDNAKNEVAQLNYRLQNMQRIGHDLNNALTVISGVFETNPSLSNDPNAKLARRAINTAHVLAQDLRGTRFTEPTPANTSTIRTAVMGAIVACRTIAHFEIEEDLWQMELDASALARVMDNLARNASHSMNSGGEITVRAYNKHARSLPCVQIEVEDSGPGVAQRELVQLFNDDFSTKSSGLGLGICRDIVERAGGEISIHSHVGQGTRVIARLPKLLAK